MLGRIFGRDKAARARTPFRRKLILEALEPRLLLSADLVGQEPLESLAIGGTTGGTVYEDGARPAVGQLSAAGTGLAWSVDEPLGMYGSLGVDDTGRWTYALFNDAPQVQDLAQGASAQDAFVVRVTDALGASATATVAVDIIGTNDFPFVQVLPGVDVFEDGTGTASGTAFGFDRDHGADLRWSVSDSPSGYSADYLILADRLVVVRDGAVIIDDGFDDGVVPTSAVPGHPGFALGGSLSESGGRMVLDGSLAGGATGVATPELTAASLATLLTNVDPLNAVNGLKRHHDFAIELTYELTAPLPGHGYGLNFSDRLSGGTVPPASTMLGDDGVFLTVYSNAQGELELRLEERNFVTDQLLVRETMLLGELPDDDQIVLRLAHDNDTPGVVRASFELLDDGAVTRSAEFSAVGHIFGADTPEIGDDESWTRVQLGAFGPDDEAAEVQGVYGSFAIDRFSGQWTYSLDQDDPDTEALGAGQIAVESFSLRVIDELGFSTRGVLNVAVHGSDGTSGEPVTQGEVFEDGGRFAVGRLSAPPAGASWGLVDAFGNPLGSFAPGAYGSLNIDPVSGSWSYSLDNLAFQVQALAQDEQVLDAFTVHLADGSGLVLDSATVTVRVTGSNDVPGIGSIVEPAEVTEDGQQTVSGQLFPFDNDNGASFSWSVATGLTGYSSDYLYAADQLTVIRNGVVVFSDGFDDGVAPPSAPVFSNGSPASYGVSGLFGESGGRLLFDGSVANATLGIATDALRVQNNAVLNTDATSDLNLGLKIDDDVVYEARFDLAIPAEGSAYGIALSDRLSSFQAGDDLILLNVFGDGAGGLRVSFDEGDIVADTITGLDAMSFAAPAGGAQIVLRLVHDNDAPGEVRAAFEVVDGAGTVLLAHSFDATGHIFGTGTPDYAADDEPFTRVQISAFGADTHGSSIAGAYGTLSVDPAGLWTYVLDNGAPQVQALQAGETAVDQFWVRLTDEHGASARFQVQVTVHGSDEAPQPVLQGEVFEDGASQAAGQLLSSVPGIPVFWDVLDAFGNPMGGFGVGTYGFLNVDGLTGQWTYHLQNFMLEVQSLAQGESVFDAFTVRTSDMFGNVLAVDTVTVKVTGSNDVPTVASLAGPAQVTEDGQQTATGQLFGIDPDHGAGFTWSIGPGPTGYASDYVFAADQLTITRNGVMIFSDGFDDGIAPPSSPGFSNGAAVSYGVSGTFAELGGRLVLEGSVANAALGLGFDNLRVQNNAALLTDASADLAFGLKIDDDFIYEMRFDFAVPDAGEAYGIALSDRLSASLAGDDLVLLNVYGDGASGVQVRLEDASIVGDFAHALESIDFLAPAGAAQIVLRLAHDNDAPGVVQGGFEVLDGGGGLLFAHSFASSATIFGAGTPTYPGDDEVFTRPQFAASGPDLNGNTMAGAYGTLSIDASGTWTYVLDNDAAHVQALVLGQAATDQFWVRVVDEYGASSRFALSITVHGSDESGGAPVTEGEVFEDGAKFAVGLLPAPQVAPGTAFTWVVATGGEYGFLNVDPFTGQWSYNLDNFALHVQALAQGEQVVDGFLVQAVDPLGAVLASESVSVTVHGSNDIPTISPSGEPAFVMEDAMPVASGQLFGTDIDNGAMLGWSVGPGPTGYSADYVVTADQMTITRNGVVIFNDTFDDGTPPPSSPGFTNGAAVSYGVSGLFSESGGRLIFDGSVANATLGIGTNVLRVQNNAVLTTDASPDLSFGLKIDDDIVYEARFDLAIPDPGEGYGIALSDRLSSAQAGDDLVMLNVFGDGAGGLRVSFDDADIVADTIAVLDSASFAAPAGGTQILLRLMHDNDAPGEVRAAFEIVDANGVALLAHTFSAAGHIFGSGTPGYPGDDEPFTRVQISAFGPDGNGTSLTGSYGTLSIAADGAWTYVLDNDAPQVQALGQFDVVTDQFWVRVTDEFGASTRFPLFITVQGAAEAPQIGGVTTGEVFEDGAQLDRGQLTAEGLAGPASWSVMDIFGNAGSFAQGSYGFLTVDSLTGEWSYFLDNFAPLVQALAQGEQASDAFTVMLYDPASALTALETVTVIVAGTNDVPGVGGDTAGSVIEDLQPTAAGRLFGLDVDNGASFTWSIGPGPTGYSSNYLVTADQMTITRNGVVIFNDTFDDGLAPPSSPGFSNGGPVSYGASGLFSESGGRLLFDGSVANATLGIGIDALRVQNNALLFTDTTPNLGFGLKLDDDIVYEARFDLAVPDAGEAYGIAFSDRLSSFQGGDDLVFLNVFGDGAGGLRVSFDDADIVADSVTMLEAASFDAPPGATQILLRLTHDVAAPGEVRAAFEVLDAGGAALLTHSFAAVGRIFGSGTPDYAGDDEPFTRAQITAFGPDVHGAVMAGDYGTLSIEPNGQWTYVLDNNAPHVQALSPEQQFTERFWVRVVDEHGASSRVPIEITVGGSNDAPVLGPIGALEVEEGATLIFTATASDVDDPIHELSFSLVGAPAGAFIDAASGAFSWTPVEQQDGEHVFLVQVSDGQLVAQQAVSITVTEDARLDAGLAANDGAADILRLVRAGDNVEGYLDIDRVFQRSLTSLGGEGLTVAGSDDADWLVLDFSGGDPIPAAGIAFDGGAGLDAMRLEGGAFTTVLYTAADAHSGGVQLDGSSITYTGLEPIEDDLDVAHRRFIFSPGDDEITLAFGAAVSSLSSPRSETVIFRNATVDLAIHGSNTGVIVGTEGDDEIVVTNDSGIVRAEVNGVAATFSGITEVRVEALGGDDSITLLGLSLPAVVRGGAGDDVIAGGAAADILDGGEGTDTLLAGRITPIAFWGFEEAAGRTVHDAAGSAQDGTLYGRDVELDGDGLALNGRGGEYVAVPHDAAFEVAQGTLQLWFRTENAGRTQVLLSKDQEGLGAGEVRIWLEEGALRVALESANASHTIVAPDAVRAGTWQQVTFTFGAAGMNLYMDGALVGSNAYSGGLVGNALPIVLGASAAHSRVDDLANLPVRHMLQGRIDDVAFFGVALSRDEIIQTMANGAMAVLAPAEVSDVRLNFESIAYYDAAPVGVPASFALRPLVDTSSYWEPEWRGFAKSAGQPHVTDFKLSFASRR